MKYLVKYDGIVIGMYNVISEKLVEYITDHEGLEEVKKKGYHLLPILTQDKEAKDIPFFSTMIANCERFGDKIKYQTNRLELEKIG